MIAYEIETGETADGSWGYVLHASEVGRGYGMVYLGEDGCGGGFADEAEARSAAERRLDERHGEGGWARL